MKTITQVKFFLKQLLLLSVFVYLLSGRSIPGVTESTPAELQSLWGGHKGLFTIFFDDSRFFFIVVRIENEYKMSLIRNITLASILPRKLHTRDANGYVL